MRAAFTAEAYTGCWLTGFVPSPSASLSAVQTPALLMKIKGPKMRASFRGDKP